MGATITRQLAKLPHQIARADVDEFLSSSVVRDTWFHRSPEAARLGILAQGVHIDDARPGAMGPGFYTSLAPVPHYGPAELEVAIHSTRSFSSKQYGFERDVQPIVDAYRAANGLKRLPRSESPVEDARAALLHSGFDSIQIQVHDGSAPTYRWLIGLDPDRIKVLVD